MNPDRGGPSHKAKSRYSEGARAPPAAGRPQPVTANASSTPSATDRSARHPPWVRADRGCRGGPKAKPATVNRPSRSKARSRCSSRASTGRNASIHAAGSGRELLHPCSPPAWARPEKCGTRDSADVFTPPFDARSACPRSADRRLSPRSDAASWIPATHGRARSAEDRSRTSRA
jgi:hypothetical protein